MQDDCVIDIGENYVRQTARNRCEILTAGGVAALAVPVHGGGKIATRDVRIDHSKRWRHRHWNAIVSAYAGSPYFEHYAERFAPVFESRRFDLLVDLNLELLSVAAGILGVAERVKISENYVVASPGDFDLRGKKALRQRDGETAGAIEAAGARIPTVFSAEYIQVFADRFGFVPGLSIIDLIMCEGPAAADLLYE
jgi:hypothetical protein